MNISYAPLSEALPPLRCEDLPDRPSRILVAEAWNATPHLETGIEISIRLALLGHVVDYLHYGSRLSYVECFNRSGSTISSKIKGHFLSPSDRATRLLRLVAKRFSLRINVLRPKDRRSPSKKKARILSDSSLVSLARLRDYSGGISQSLGVSVASSLVSCLKDSAAIPGDHVDLCERLAQSFCESRAMVKEALNSADYSNLVVFNGRFACVKGAVCAAQEQKVPILFHERGADKTRFSLKSYQPHDRIKLQQDICQAWVSALSAGLKPENTARRFFLERRTGVEQSWTSFSSSFEAGLSSSIFEQAQIASTTGKVVVYFSSSDDEFTSIGDLFGDRHSVWLCQKDAVQALVAQVVGQGHGLIIRVHPHQQKKSDSDRRSWDEMSFVEDDLRARITIVPSESTISSYELIEQADVVVTYGSTVGIEAVYWGKPSILLGLSFYDKISASIYCPKSVSDLEVIFSNLDQLETDPASALPYGFYQSTFGTKYVLYQPKSLFSGVLLGVSLHRTRAQWLDNVAQKFSRIKKGSRFSRILRWCRSQFIGFKRPG